jgi:3-deoxy-7-phosphoheptulonate synthase
MVITTRAGVEPRRVDALRERLEQEGRRTRLLWRDRQALVCCPDHGTGGIPFGWEHDPDIESVTTWSRPYRLASRDAAPRRSTTPVPIGGVGGRVVGGAAIVVIAGPCSVDRRDLLLASAEGVRRAGAVALRGGAYKPRTSPYEFQGLGPRGLALLAEARLASGLPVVTEVLDPRHVELVAEHADVLQIGARNMQNYALLAEVARVGRPVLLKRGLSATITEFLLAAEHILARGGSGVMLCERGMRTFEQATRFTLDISAIPVLKQETHLPVIVDPSHAAGRASLVPALACAAVAAGADGIMVEAHAEPELSRSDRDQALSLEAFDGLMRQLDRFAAAAGRPLAGRVP